MLCYKLNGSNSVAQSSYIWKRCQAAEEDTAGVLEKADMGGEC